MALRGHLRREHNSSMEWAPTIDLPDINGDTSEGPLASLSMKWSTLAMVRLKQTTVNPVSMNSGTPTVVRDVQNELLLATMYKIVHSVPSLQ
jgi:hypothetical protein